VIRPHATDVDEKLSPLWASSSGIPPSDFFKPKTCDSGADGERTLPPEDFVLQPDPRPASYQMKKLLEDRPRGIDVFFQLCPWSSLSLGENPERVAFLREKSRNQSGPFPPSHLPKLTISLPGGFDPFFLTEVSGSDIKGFPFLSNGLQEFRFLQLWSFKN